MVEPGKPTAPGSTTAGGGSTPGQDRGMAGQAADAVSNTAGRLGDRARDMGEDFYERGQQATAAMRGRVEGQPWVAVGLALGLGIMIGILVERGRH